MPADIPAQAGTNEALLQIGQRIGNYRVTRKLGQGGMGAVFEAVHEYIGRKAAIKVLHPDLSQNPQFATRFLNEARAVNLVKHPGLVEIFEFGVLEDGTPYIVMEFLEGESLAQRLRRTAGGLGDEALSICHQIARAMAAAHMKEIVHRDLKPENVMLVSDPERPDGRRAKVLDFGIAKLSTETDGKMRTETGTMIGTPAYMAPEQCLGASSVDGKADVYALGVMLYEMLAGCLPFEARHSFDFMAAHVRQEPRPLATVVPAVPTEVANLVHEMLVKDPAERPSMETVVTLIEQLSAALPAISAKSMRASAEFRSSKELALGATAAGPSSRSSRPSKELIAFGSTAPGLPSPLPMRRPTKESLPSVTPQLAAVQSFADASAGAGRKRAALLSAGLVFLTLLSVALLRRVPQPRPQTGTAQSQAANSAVRTVKWNVTSTPPGAEVIREDGKVLGSTPWQLERTAGPGETTLTLRLPNHHDKTIVLDHSTDVKTEVPLVALAAPAAAAAGEKEAHMEPKSATGGKARKVRSRQSAKKSAEDDVKLLMD